MRRTRPCRPLAKPSSSTPPRNPATARIPRSSCAATRPAAAFYGLTLTAGNSTITGLAVNRFTADGILVHGAGATGDLIAGDYVGTDITGTTALTNGYGIEISGGAGNTIGGTTSAARNVLFSGGSGSLVIVVAGTGASGNLVEGNYLDVTAAGSAALGNGYDGIDITAPNNTVGGTASGAGNVVAGYSNIGIYAGLGSSGTLIEGNYVGTNAGGTAAVGSGGVGVSVGDTNITIGGTASGAGNVISGNGEGVATDGNGTLIEGNDIGTDYTSTAAIANGISIRIFSTGNTIGGTVGGAGNVIGDTGTGIQFLGGATGNLVQGNAIGTDTTGTDQLGSGYGLDVQGAGNTIGGTSSAARNLVFGGTGSGGVGIYVRGTGGTGNLIQGNYLDVNAAGTAAIASSYDGVVIETANNTLGGTVSGAGNVISGFTNLPVYLGPGSDGSLVAGNFIGTNAAGTAAIGNAGDGISIVSNNNTVGGTTSAARNVISGNSGDGLLLDGAQNLVQGNYIGTNAAGNAAIANGLQGVYLAHRAEQHHRRHVRGRCQRHLRQHVVRDSVRRRRLDRQPDREQPDRRQGRRREFAQRQRLARHRQRLVRPGRGRVERQRRQSGIAQHRQWAGDPQHHRQLHRE